MFESPSSEAPRAVTQILGRLDRGEGEEREASEKLLPFVYADLRKLATARMARLAPGQTFQATALVHEAYVRLVGSTDPGWHGRAHFFGAAARAMRDILADHLQRKGSLKHGGYMRRVESETLVELASDGPSENALAVEEALQALEREYPRKAQAVTLNFFGGLTAKESAALLGLSARTIEGDLRFAKAWLNSWLSEREPR